MKQHLLGILLAVAACFGVHHPTLAQNTKDIVDRLNTSLGVSLPSQYQTTVKNFLATHAKMQKKIRPRFTEQFIKDQMKTNWGINKQNQLLFIWDAVYEQITGKQLYTGEDGNQTRLNEFEKAIEKAEACGKKYNKEFDAYLDQVIADADRRSAEADRDIIRATNSRLNNLIKFYNLYRNDPSSVRQSELNQMKRSAKEIIQDCKEYNIEYKSKLSPEIRKFYGIE